MARLPMLRYPLLLLLTNILVATSVQAEPIKLSVLHSTSGLRKGSGTSYKNGFLLGLREEAKTQHVDWTSLVTVEFLDHRRDKARALQLTKDAIAGGAKAIIGPGPSGIGVTIRDYVLDEAKVPLIVFASVSDKMRRQHPLFIRLSRSIPLYSLALARWLKANPLGSRAKPRWACIHSDYVWGVGICDAFKRFYGVAGEEIGRVAVPLKTVRMKKEITEMAKLKPDFALAVFSGRENEVFYNNYYRFNVNKVIPLVTISAAVTPKLLQSYEKTLEDYGTAVGLTACDIYMPEVATPVNQHFVTLVKQTYQTTPDFRHVWAYDAGRLLIKALVELDGKWDGAKIVELMKTLPYTSPRQAQPLQFDSHGDVMNGAYITQVKRHGNRLVKEIIGTVPAINLDEILQ